MPRQYRLKLIKMIGIAQELWRHSHEVSLEVVAMLLSFDLLDIVDPLLGYLCWLNWVVLIVNARGHGNQFLLRKTALDHQIEKCHLIWLEWQWTKVFDVFHFVDIREISLLLLFNKSLYLLSLRLATYDSSTLSQASIPLQLIEVANKLCFFDCKWWWGGHHLELFEIVRCI